MNPCTSATIDSFAVPSSLSIEQFGSQNLDLTQTSSWPWKDVIEVATGVFKEGMCGSMTVEFFIFGTTDVPQYLSFNQETGFLNLSPLIDDPVGTHRITMKVSLADYSTVFTTTNFDIMIISTDDCAFDTLTFANDLEDTVYQFSWPPLSITFDP